MSRAHHSSLRYEQKILQNKQLKKRVEKIRKTLSKGLLMSPIITRLS